MSTREVSQAGAGSRNGTDGNEYALSDLDGADWSALINPIAAGDTVSFEGTLTADLRCTTTAGAVGNPIILSGGTWQIVNANGIVPRVNYLRFTGMTITDQPSGPGTLFAINPSDDTAIGVELLDSTLDANGQSSARAIWLFDCAAQDCKIERVTCTDFDLSSLEWTGDTAGQTVDNLTVDSLTVTGATNAGDEPVLFESESGIDGAGVINSTFANSSVEGTSATVYLVKFNHIYGAGIADYTNANNTISGWFLDGGYGGLQYRGKNSTLSFLNSVNCAAQSPINVVNGSGVDTIDCVVKDAAVAAGAFDGHAFHGGGTDCDWLRGRARNLDGRADSDNSGSCMHLSDFTDAQWLYKFSNTRFIAIDGHDARHGLTDNTQGAETGDVTVAQCTLSLLGHAGVKNLSGSDHATGSLINRNNIFVGINSGDVGYENLDASDAGQDEDYCFFYNFSSNATNHSFGSNSVTDTDPLLIDATNGDNRLQAASPCVRAGAQWWTTTPTGIDGVAFA